MKISIQRDKVEKYKPIMSLVGYTTYTKPQPLAMSISTGV